MKTLLFCTAYSDSEDTWNGRYKSWYNYYKTSQLRVSKLLIVDDGSPVKPDFLGENEYKRFDDRLGRFDVLNYPGWYRSFGYGISEGDRQNFDKIIHAESDAYLLSPRVIDFVNSIESGWHTFWSPRHGIPESAIQIICKDQFSEAKIVTNYVYSKYIGQCMDSILPYTNIHKNFIGDRYGETGDMIPDGVDFSCQTSSNMINSYK